MRPDMLIPSLKSLALICPSLEGRVQGFGAPFPEVRQ
jgi:hypothetical protein